MEECTFCNGAGIIDELSDRYCFVCGGSGKQSMSFWSEEIEQKPNKKGKLQKKKTSKLVRKA